MAAFIPNRKDAEVNDAALAAVRADKSREADDGFDGSWVAHPDLVPVASRSSTPSSATARTSSTAAARTCRSPPPSCSTPRRRPGEVTEAGVRNNVSVGIQYLESWLRGGGAVAIFNLMEDAATAEISRSQVWQWVHNGVSTAEGTAITPEWVRQVEDEELEKIRQSVGDERFAGRPVRRGARAVRAGRPGRRLRGVPDPAGLRADRLMTAGVQAPARSLQLADDLRTRIGADKVLTDPAQLRTYECDGLTNFRVRPAWSSWPPTRDDVVETVRLCAERRSPVRGPRFGHRPVRRSAAVADGVLIVLSRLRRSSRVDPDNQRVVVEPGVINLWVTREATPYGQAYAPDPSSQQVCTIGGNVAENAGGAHCLKYGFTVNHVMGAEVVLPDGEVVHLGGTAPEHPGYDLLGAFVGSEGTLGIATEVTLRMIRVPESVQTMLVGFRTVEDAGGAVSDIIAAGILPAAIEMMDALAIQAAEAAVQLRLPRRRRRRPRHRARRTAGRGRRAVPPGGAARRRAATRSRRASRRTPPSGPSCGRAASPPSPRSAASARPTSCRTASSRAPSSPRCSPRSTAWPTRVGLRVANVFHAGDGNLHPLVLFDDAVDGAAETPRSWPAPSSTSASTRAAPSPASTASATRRRRRWRGSSAPTTSTRCSSSAAPSTPPGSPTPARSSRRRGCAASVPGIRTAADTRDPAPGEVF